MNKIKIFLTSTLLVTSAAWGQPDEYLHEVEDSPTSMAVLFDDTAEIKAIVNVEALPAPETIAELSAPAPTKKASRSIASIPQVDCKALAQKITKGEKISDIEMSNYSKNCN